MSASERRVRLAAAALALLVFTLFFATNFDGAFVFDDENNILLNRGVTAFDPGSWAAWKEAALDSPARLRPLPYLSFAWQWHLSGGAPGPFHFVNDLLHALAALALFLLLLEFIGAHGGRLKERAFTISLCGALLWALHPLQTSAVTFLVQRMSVMSGLFQLLALWLYLRGRRRERAADYTVAALCYLLALGSKENAATLPVVVILYEWLLGAHEPRRARVARFAALGLALLPPLAMAAAYARLSGEHFALGTLPGRDFTLWERVLSAPRVYLMYGKLLALPLNQALDYQMPPSRSLLAPWTTLPALLLVLGILGACLYYRRRRAAASFAVLAFFAALAPESTFLNLELFYEHRAYSACAPLLALVPAGLWLVLERYRADPALRRVALALPIVLCALLSVARNRQWHSELQLLESNVAARPRNARAVALLGVELYRQGRFEEALQKGLAAEQMGFDAPQLHYNLGLAYGALGDVESAHARLTRAVAEDPHYANAYAALADLYGRAGDVDAAIGYYRLAVENDPLLAAAHYNLAEAYRFKGEPGLARHYYQRACELGETRACERL